MENVRLVVIKQIFIVFNVLLAISGFILTVFGIRVLVDDRTYNDFYDWKIPLLASLFLIIGVFVFLIALLGCYAAIRESYDMLVKYGLCLLVIFVVQLGVVIAAAIIESDFGITLKSNMQDKLVAYDASESNKAAWDNLHANLRCCGVDGPRDWGKNNKPSTCCHKSGLSPTFRQNPEPNITSTEKSPKDCEDDDDEFVSGGCYTKLHSKLTLNTDVLIAFGVVMAILEIVGMILAYWLSLKIKQQESQAT